MKTLPRNQHHRIHFRCRHCGQWSMNLDRNAVPVPSQPGFIRVQTRHVEGVCDRCIKDGQPVGATRYFDGHGAELFVPVKRVRVKAVTK